MCGSTAGLRADRPNLVDEEVGLTSACYRRPEISISLCFNHSILISLNCN